MTNYMTVFIRFKNYYKEIRQVCSVPLAVLVDEGIVEWSPLRESYSKALSGSGCETESGLVVPSHVAQLVYLLRVPRTVRHSGEAFPSSDELYAFVENVKNGEPMLEPPSGNVMMVSLGVLLRSFGPILGKDSWHHLNEYLNEEYEPTYEVLLEVAYNLMNPVQTFLFNGVLCWAGQWLLSAPAFPDYAAPEDLLAQFVAPVLTRPLTEPTRADAPLIQFVLQCTRDTLQNIDTVISTWQEYQTDNQDETNNGQEEYVEE
ncbi:hypothetical protein GNI_075580 [Gregarina niphandrodes]|uniref:Uncharacterized protein n=1 Tax=Gregarina niphandrodes TaxID=110365 RepID=A0A023B6T1_GRENI|nr:hypothetical protein GNI_075580 [Gregarina niphandrodes]EZG66801.1 hypothetical protein GNI_075580 [Gregarina niphandrodes]|eukprot:XP_011130483.1 hypothetical protein GNI_075580 [Gregarina niphandrodes]